MQDGYKISPLDVFIIVAFCLLIWLLIWMCFRKRRWLEQANERSTQSLMFIPTPYGFRMATAAPRSLQSSSPLTLSEVEAFRWISHFLGSHALQTENEMLTQESMQEARSKRVDYVHSSLIHRHVFLATAQTAKSSTDDPTTKSDILLHSASLENNGVDVESGGDDGEGEPAADSQPGCAICLKDYVDGDRICWSSNPSCSHHFHCDCVEEWLLRNEECPLCREWYVTMAVDMDAIEGGEVVRGDSSAVPPLPRTTQLGMPPVSNAGENTHMIQPSFNYRRNTYNENPADQSLQHLYPLAALILEGILSANPPINVDDEEPYDAQNLAEYGPTSSTGTSDDAENAS